MFESCGLFSLQEVGFLYLLSVNFNYGQGLDIDALQTRLSHTSTFTCRNPTISHCFILYFLFTSVAICCCINLNLMFSILYLINPFDYCTFLTI